MDVSIIILNYKTAGLVRQCVKTIELHEPTVRFEVIVVDNASDDGIGDALRKAHPDVRFIGAPANLGFAAGNNLGIRAARGRYVLILNPDITVREGAIDAMVAYMDANPGIGALGPKLVRPDGSLDESVHRFPTPMIPVYRRTPLGKTKAGRDALAWYGMGEFDRSETRDVDWLLGAALMVRKSVLDEVGLLDERFFLYFEDTDWCRRFWKAGHRVTFYADAEMVHYHERQSARGNWILSPFRKSTRIHIASAFKYFRKWGAEPVDVRASKNPS